jgi:ubiquinone/menaquinone biosynthesis C-methylase UbiE
MMFTRYATAASLAANRRVLELGCGAGQGFGLLTESATQVVGGDYSMALLKLAKKHFGFRVPLVRLSAEALPFNDSTFDLVLFFEASYYVRDMEKAFDDIARVLAPGGTVLFVNANPQRTDFIRSPHSVHYHTAEEFRAALRQRGFHVTLSGAFPAKALPSGARSHVVSSLISFARRMLEAVRLVPTTLKGRARLKKLLYSKMSVVPPELHAGFANIADIAPLDVHSPSDYKVIYVQGTRVA